MESFILSLILSLLKILSLCVILGAVLIALFSLYIIYVRRKYAHIPTPRFKNFFRGHLGDLKRIDVHLSFVKWINECGGLFQIFVFHRVIVMVTKPSLVKELLTNSKYSKDPANYNTVANLVGERFLGRGLVTNTNHEDWKVKRHYLNPSFHKTVISGFIRCFNDAGDRLIRKLETYADTDQLVPMLKLMHTTTLDVIGQVAFSEDILTSGDKNDNIDLCESVNTCLKTMEKSFINPLFAKMPWNRHEIRQARQEVLNLRNRAMRMIERRIEAISKGEQTPEDILDAIVRNMAGTCPMEELVDEVVTIFVAGQETTANLVSFFLLELGRQPMLKQKVYEEVDSVIEDKKDISIEDISKLEYVTPCLKEILRLYPPLLGTSRIVPDNETINLEGYAIPPSTTIIISIIGLHYTEHKDAFAFKPERFLKNCEPSLEPKLFSYIPFSAGQRSCIGRNFAYIEAKILLSKILQRFNYRLNPKESFGIENAGTQRPADGVQIFLYSR